MHIRNSAFIRNVLVADGATGAVAALVTVPGAGLLSPVLGLPAGLLFWAGMALVPIAVFLFAMARRETIPRGWLREIAAVNAVWVAASFAILIAGLVEPTMLGIAFVLAQALAVALFAVLQLTILRANRPELAA